MESDGNIEYKVTLIAREDASVEDIGLRTHLAPGIGRYMMGLGEKGGYCPKDLRWKWNVEKNQDGLGRRCQCRPPDPFLRQYI